MTFFLVAWRLWASSAPCPERSWDPQAIARHRLGSWHWNPPCPGHGHSIYCTLPPRPWKKLLQFILNPFSPHFQWFSMIFNDFQWDEWKIWWKSHRKSDLRSSAQDIHITQGRHGRVPQHRISIGQLQTPGAWGHVAARVLKDSLSTWLTIYLNSTKLEIYQTMLKITHI